MTPHQYEQVADPTARQATTPPAIASSRVCEMKEQMSGLPGTTFNLANGIVGAGIIGLPFAMSQAGFALGTSLLLLVAILTHYTVILMIQLGRVNGVSTYEGLCEAAFGTLGFYSLSVFQIANSFGACVAYILIIAETVPRVLQHWGIASVFEPLGDKAVLTVLLTILILLPLCLYRMFS